ncbi:MAG: hypothetical protein OEZ01_09285, partial [Candidatus Heimdallarchaeota archaeon]|nr:hypothetical protein [Candidatus Heimdallarchaeota archaeon]
DVIFRCILSALRPIGTGIDNKVYAYLKNGEHPGYLSMQSSDIDPNEDEISLAYKIKNNWDTYFTKKSLQELIAEWPNADIWHLHEDGISLSDATIEHLNSIFVLGAQSDLTEEDLQKIQPMGNVKIGETSMLASQVIAYVRLKLSL